MMDGLGSHTRHAMGPSVQFSVHTNRAINDRPAHTAGRHLLSVVQAVTNTDHL